MNLIRPIALLLLLSTGPAIAQGQIDFGGLTQDTSLPVEVTADQLDVDQNDGSAVFAGNVLVTQGEMRLTAQRIRVNYAGQDQGRIQTLNATGGVTLVNGAEAAEAQEAVYNIDSSELEKSIFVEIASQGRNTATVTLKVKALPIEKFRPQVEMRKVSVLAFGKYPTTRELPHVRVQYFRRGRPQYIRPAFPLKQRSSGTLASGGKIRRRTGQARGKLTVLRYYTFPKRHLEKMLPELLKVAGENVTVTFSAAWRNRVGALRRNQ